MFNYSKQSLPGTKKSSYKNFVEIPSHFTSTNERTYFSKRNCQFRMMRWLCREGRKRFRKRSNGRKKNASKLKKNKESNKHLTDYKEHHCLKVGLEALLLKVEFKVSTGDLLSAISVRKRKTKQCFLTSQILRMKWKFHLLNDHLCRLKLHLQTWTSLKWVRDQDVSWHGRPLDGLSLWHWVENL